MAKKTMRDCLCCGGEYKPTSNSQKFCSRLCQLDFHEMRRLEGCLPARGELIDRSKRANWIKYMQENPIYFTSIFWMLPKPGNIRAEWRELNRGGGI